MSGQTATAERPTYEGLAPVVEGASERFLGDTAADGMIVLRYDADDRLAYGDRRVEE